jgi:hypothetical protein
LDSASQLLEYALEAKTNGVPSSLLECSIGLILISVVEAIFIFSRKQNYGLWISM